MKDRLFQWARWVVAIVVLVLAGLFLYRNLYQVHGPMVVSVDDRLPILFHPSPRVFWLWVFGLGAVSVALAYWASRNARALRIPAASLKAVEADDQSASILAAWDEIAARLCRVPRPPIYLVLAPEKEQAIALLAASGLPIDQSVPSTADAPLAGFATELGLILWCGGRIAATVELVCRKLQGATGDDSMVRGIVVLMPAALLDGPPAQLLANSARAGLRAAMKSLSTRCPVYLIVTGMENVPGFLEFAHRMPPTQRARGRFGFSLPETPESFDTRVASEFSRFRRWYEASVLDLIAADPLAQTGNTELYSLGRWFLRSERGLLKVVETLADLGGDDDPLELLGCYWVATGPDPDLRAYAAGVVMGRVVGDPNSARWSRRTLETDRRQRRSAFVLGAVGAALALAAWSYILLGSGSLGVAGWVVFLATAIGWFVACFRVVRKAAPSPAL